MVLFLRMNLRIRDFQIHLLKICRIFLENFQNIWIEYILLWVWTGYYQDGSSDGWCNWRVSSLEGRYKILKCVITTEAASRILEERCKGNRGLGCRKSELWKRAKGYIWGDDGCLLEFISGESKYIEVWLFDLMLCFIHESIFFIKDEGLLSSTLVICLAVIETYFRFVAAFLFPLQEQRNFA